MPATGSLNSGIREKRLAAKVLRVTYDSGIGSEAVSGNSFGKFDVIKSWKPCVVKLDCGCDWFDWGNFLLY